MDIDDVEISRLRDRAYVDGLTVEVMIQLAERWEATGHYHCQDISFPSGSETFDWTDFAAVSRLLGALAEARDIDSGPIAVLSESIEHAKDIDPSVAQQAFAAIRRLVAKLWHVDDGKGKHDDDGVDEMPTEGSERPWNPGDKDYITLSDAATILAHGGWALSTVSKWLKPDRPVRYMRQGRRCMVHREDFRKLIKVKDAERGQI